MRANIRWPKWLTRLSHYRAASVRAEELLEVYTWLQLKIHAKPVGVLNVNGYFDYLLSFLEHMENSGFLKPSHRRLLLIDQEPAGLLKKLEEFVPKLIDKTILIPE